MTSAGGSPHRLLGPAEIRQLADRIGLRPTKTLGQNFVHDANTVRRIVAAAELDATDHVLEVGPGLGSLTLALLDVAAAVAAVEIDPRLAALLPETVTAHDPDRAGALRVIAADALRLRAADLRPPPTALVANLPYNVAVPVLLHLLAELPSLRRVLVMVQAEVADRLVASPGSRTYGVPSVKIAWYGHARRAGAVGRAVFWPVPGVDSALVALDRAPVSGRDVAGDHRGTAGDHTAPPVNASAAPSDVPGACTDVPAAPTDVSGPPTDVPAAPADVPRDHVAPPTAADRAAVFGVIDAAFAQRRKTLRSALAGWAGSAGDAERICRAAGVDPAARGETLGIDAYIALARQRDRQHDRQLARQPEAAR